MAGERFTPGPWRIEYSLECAYVRADCEVCAARGAKEPIGIAQLFRTGSGDDHPEREAANAALIEAAPDLYEALLGLLALVRKCGTYTEPNLDWHAPIDAAYAALAKAAPAEQSDAGERK